MASRWSPLGTPSGSRDTQRMGQRVTVVITKRGIRLKRQWVYAAWEGGTADRARVRTGHLLWVRGGKRV